MFQTLNVVTTTSGGNWLEMTFTDMKQILHLTKSCMSRYGEFGCHFPTPVKPYDFDLGSDALP